MKNAKTWVSPKRTKQLRNIVESTKVSLKWDIHPDDRDDLIIQNKEASRAEVADILEIKENKINKTEAKKLAIFLKNYLSSLTISEYNQLHRTINSILDYNASNYPMMEEYFNYHKSYDVPLFDSLFKIISEKVLFPKTETQEEFNNEFKSILYRYFNKTQKEAKKESFHINTIDTDLILTYMSEAWLYRFNNSIEIDNGINLFTYNINIKNPQSEHPMDNYNDFSYKISLGKIGWNWISRAEFYKYVKNREFKEINQNIFYLWWDRDFNVHMEIKERFVNNWFQSNWEDSKEVFDVEFFVFQKTELNTFEYFSNASLILNKEVSEFMSKLYKIFPVFPDSKNFINIDPDEIYDRIADVDGGDEKSNRTTISLWKWMTNSSKTLEKKNTNNKAIIDNDIISTIDEMILEESEKRELKKIVNMFNFPEHFAEYWLDLPKWMILAGPPGVWKTTFLKLLAKLTNSEFIHISHTDITSKWEWESEKNIKAKFDQARKLVAQGKKVIMAFDEWDSLFEARGEERNNKEWIISVILAELDWFDAESSKNIFVTILTNRPEAVDPALKERLNKKVTLSLPTKSQRVEHLKLNIDYIKRKSKKEIFAWDIDLEKIASKIDKKSGRFIKNLIINAADDFANKALDSDISLISTDDIISAIKYTDEQEKEETKEKVMWFWRQNGK